MVPATPPEHPWSFLRRVEAALRDTLKPFMASGLELSVEVTDQRLTFFPFEAGQWTGAKHWDDGVTQFLDSYWQYSTAMPPVSAS
jgi:hypothetical protein